MYTAVWAPNTQTEFIKNICMFVQQESIGFEFFGYIVEYFWLEYV